MISRKRINRTALGTTRFDEKSLNIIESVTIQDFRFWSCDNECANKIDVTAAETSLIKLPFGSILFTLYEDEENVEVKYVWNDTSKEIDCIKLNEASKTKGKSIKILTL